MNKSTRMEIFFWLNVLEIAGIILLLILALAFQYFLSEAPCPLCLLQRAGLLITSLGLLFNIRYGISEIHYTFTLLGALFTSFVALRQILLHITPGDPGFGTAIFGLHLYTWSFIICMIIVIYTAIILGFQSQYRQIHRLYTPKIHKKHPKTYYLIFTLIFTLALINFLSLIIVM